MPPNPIKRIRVVFRRDTVENWILKNPVLLAGEPGVEEETDLMKIGDGERGWNSLPYVNGYENAIDTEVVLAQLQAHKDDISPHPAYDDMPSLKLLYENSKV